ncbi:hypothetical protein FQR65_LT01372 [Abscondita terminalis]|nr:hypothetical protein FQR65_LT01372 [Abscondita terminalis]
MLSCYTSQTVHDYLGSLLPNMKAENKEEVCVIEKEESTYSRTLRKLKENITEKEDIEDIKNIKKTAKGDILIRLNEGNTRVKEKVKEIWAKNENGPTWKPFIGSSGILKEYSKKYGGQHIALHELSKKWKTQILGMKVGQVYIVCVEGYENVRKLMTNEMNQRPLNFFMKLRTLGTYKGITCAEGPLWIEQRKFAMRHLRNICMNNCVTNSKIHFEIDSLINIIDKEKKVEPSKLLPFSVLNVLWSLVANNKIGNHTEQIQLLNIMCERTRAFDISGGILGQYPWFRHIAPDKSGYNLIKKLNNALKNFLLQTINNHHSDWSEGDNNDFIYSFISEMKKQNGKDTTFTDEQLLLVCLDLFVGGFTTTSGTLDFIFLLMIHHQDVQKKIQKVLDATFCKDQPIEYDDRYKVPYVEAVIRETQRLRPVGPILGPRRNIDNINLNGYVIPKNSTVLFNLRSTLMSKEIWGDPERFRPERFLDEQGKLISYPEFIPFGLGKRKCLGEVLAKNWLFLFTAEILRTFTILPVDCNNLPSLAPLPGITLSPQPYVAKFVRRQC